MKIEYKVVPVVQTKVIDEAQGIVGAYVSVTGVVDSVKDRILPGAYQKTLVARTPKGVWSHDWDKPVSKTLAAEELLPGDDRLPEKTRNGEEWPATAGALYVETQFNLKTQRGREAFDDVVFYGEDQEWSIGYNVPPGASRVDAKTGVRELSYIDLYEYSPVLFGAMPLTATAGFKAAQEAFRAAVKAGEVTDGQVTEVEVEPTEVTQADISMGDVVVVPAGTLRSDASRMLVEALAGKGQEAVTEDTPEGRAQLVANQEFGAGVEGFVEVTEDTPVTTPADPIYQVAPGHTGDRAGVEVEPRPAVTMAGSEVEEPKSATFDVGLNEKGAAAVAAVLEWYGTESRKNGANQTAVSEEAVARHAAVLADPANYTIKARDVDTEGKAMVTLTGSYEERQQALARVSSGIRDEFDLTGEDDWGYPRYYLATEATFNNRVVYAAYDLNGEDPVRFFEAGYAFDGQQAALRSPREVRVEAAVAAKCAARGAKLAKAMDEFHDVADEAEATTRLVVGRGNKTMYVSVEVASKDAFDNSAVRDAIEKALEPLVPDVLPSAPAPDAPKSDDPGALTEADLLALEHLKLYA